jgi:hypothetical protein
VRAHALVRVLAIAVMLCTTHAIAANESVDFEKARAAYVARNYDDCETRLSALLDPTNPKLRDPILVTQARMYLGAAKIQRGHADEGSKIFETLLLSDPQYDPDPLSFSGPVLEVFYDTRARIRERLAAQAQADAKRAAEKRAQEVAEKRRNEERVRKLAELAGQESLYVRNSRLVASIPFGAGQFQNRQPALGWVFMGVESALLAGSIITVPFWLSDFAASKRTASPVEARQYLDRAETITYANWGMLGGFALLATVGILQAHVNFVPSFHEVRPRPMPKDLVPLINVSERGGSVGLRMSF